MASPTARSPRVSLAEPYKRSPRVSRRPQHRFNLITKPYQLQPFMIAPVLPGETLKNLMLQSQVWSDPLAATMKNVGWWCEYNFFYVKHRDLEGYEVATDGLGKDLIDMFVSAESLAAHQDADGLAWTYCPPNGVDYVLSATKRCVEEYFRDEGEAWDEASLDGVPLVKIYGKGQSDWAEKLTLASAYEDRREAVPTYLNEMETSWQEWAVMRDAGVVDMDYEDWMRTYGGTTRGQTNPDRVDYHRPEDMAYIREFTYPTNTVEPSTGVPAVAVGWRVAKRLDKGFMFQEPGWIIGFNAVRPKVYLGNQEGNVAAMMQSRESWLPAILNDQMDVSHLSIATDTGPLKTVSSATGWNEGYWIDLRDLLRKGDQFVNYAPDGPGFMALPSTAGDRRYAGSTEIMEMFSDTVNGRFRQDGICSLNILGRQPESGRNLVLGQA